MFRSIFVYVVIGLSLPFLAFAKDENAVEKIEKAKSSDQTPLPLEEIKTFAQIFARIKREYVEQVTDEELLDYAIAGMLSGLDPHSTYLREQDFTDLKEGSSGRFGGLGIEVMMEGSFVKVIAPIDDTPAAKADIQSGDLIVRIDDKPVNGMDLTDAIELMRGEPDSPITLTIVRGESNEPFTVKLIRDVIRVKTVRSERFDNDIGYIRISQFQETTADLFRKELAKLKSKKPLAGLVLDLRNNPGGLLNSAISISDAFIGDGVLVSIKGRGSDNQRAYNATPGDLLDKAPIVVLVNSGSASASEIVAGALQDHQRGLIIGTESFGKGSVQSVMDITDKIGIKLTTARYYTPSGRSIQASGIAPDIVVEQRQFKKVEKKWKSIKENDLSGHLENNTDEVVIEEIEPEERPELNDYQLNEALNLLKGMTILQGKKVKDKNALDKKSQASLDDKNKS